MPRLGQRYLRIFAVAAGIGALILIILRTSEVPPRQRPQKTAIAATIYPLYDIVRNVTGNELGVRLIVPPGASPHFFEPSPRDLRDLQDVKIVFAIGHGLDDWAMQLTASVRDAQFVAVDQGIVLRRSGDGSIDPHYWLHYGNARQMTQNIAQALINLDPVHAPSYRTNAAAFQSKLEDEERKMRQQLSIVHDMPILTFHDAWSYFAQDMGLTLAGTFESGSEGEPTPRRLTALQHIVTSQHVRMIFIEPQLSAGVLESFARDNRIEIAELDPLGGVEGRDSYLELMAFNARIYCCS